MKFNKGFTLIEVMIVLTIIGILVALVAPILSGHPVKRKDYQCIAGYKFTPRGEQIFSEEKRGVPCVEQ